MSNPSEITWEMLEAIPPTYWLKVCNGLKAIRTLLAISNNEDLIRALQKYPILVFPLLPRAIEVLGQTQRDEQIQGGLIQLSSRLRKAQRILQSSDKQAHATLLHNLAIYLTEEHHGQYQLNLKTAILLLQDACATFLGDSPLFISCLEHKVIAWLRLAEQGVEGRENLLTVIQLCETARAVLPSDSLDFASFLINESSARVSLADQGVETRENLLTTIQLCETARTILPDDSPGFALCLMNEGNARSTLAEQGIETRENLLRAIHLNETARTIFPKDSPNFAGCLLNEGNARSTLAEQGIETRENLQRAIQLYETARATFPSNSRHFARCLINEGNVRLRLAEQVVETRDHLLKAIQLYEAARTIFPSDSSSFTVCLLNEGVARRILAEQGVEARENLLRAIQLCETGRTIFPSDSRNFARCLVNEGIARRILALQGVETRENLRKSVRLCETACTILPGGSSDFALSLMNEGVARGFLAEQGVETRENLLQAIQLYETARTIFPNDSPDFASSLMNEGDTRVSLAERGFETRKNLRAAVLRYKSAAVIFNESGGNLKSIKAFAGLGSAYLVFARNSTELRESYWKEAKDSFASAIDLIERIRAGLTLRQDRHAVLEQNAGIFRAMVEVCLQLKSYREALEYVERGRSRLLLDLLYSRDFTPRNVSPETIEEYQRMLQRANELDTLLSSEASLGMIGISGKRAVNESGEERAASLQRDRVARERITAFKQEREKVLGILREKDEEIRKQDPDYFVLGKPADWAAMQKTARESDRTLVTFWIGQEQSMVFFVRPNGEFHFQPLEHTSIATLLDLLNGTDASNFGGWYSTYSKYLNGSVSLSEWMKQIDETIAELQKRLIKPVQQELNGWGDSRVAFSVSGLLGLLPLHTAAQTLKHGKDDVLDIIYTPSVWVLQRCLERERSMETPVGIVATSGDGPELHFVLWEQDGIKRRIEERKGANTCKCLPASGQLATAEAVSGFLSALSVAHFACHGVWNQANPLNSALSLDGGSSLSLSMLLGETRCDQARLVVLSACESAIGLQANSAGEEYFGLPAGFLFAGVRTVIGSLWSVPDLSTALLMQRLYEELLARKKVSIALQSAQHWLRNLTREEVKEFIQEAEEFLNESFDFTELNQIGEHPFAHPYFWGAFQVLGNPAPIFNTTN